MEYLPEAQGDSDWDCTTGLIVQACDGPLVELPNVAVRASGLLCTLAADDLASTAEGAGTEDVVESADLQADAEGRPLVALPFAGCSAAALHRVADALQPGGLPFSLRWEPGDAEGLAAAVTVLRCLQFLDVPLLLEYACTDLAAVIAHRCVDAAAVAALLVAEASGSTAAKGSDFAHPEASELLAAGPVLGDRGRSFVEAWSDSQCALSQLSIECMEEILTRADAMVREDAGVRQLLRFAELCSSEESNAADVCTIEGAQVAADVAGPLCWPASPSSPSGYNSRTESGSPSCPYTLVDLEALSEFSRRVCYAVDVIMARSRRYRGSSLLVEALAMYATAESYHSEVRVRSVRALGQLASQHNKRAADAILEVLLAGSLTNSQAKTSEGEVKSPAEAAAKRWGLDVAWRVRVEACAVLERLAPRGDEDAVAALAGLACHGYFEVRTVVARTLGDMATPADSVATKALVTLLVDDDWRVREASAKALTGLAALSTGEGSSAPLTDLVNAICAQLTNLNSDVRQLVCANLRMITAQGGAVVAAMVVGALVRAAPGRRVPLLRRPSAEVRSAVVEALGDALAALACQEDICQPALAAALEEALQAVCESLADRSGLVRRAAAAMLRDPAEGTARLPQKTCERVTALASAIVLADAPGKSVEEALQVIGITATRGEESASAAASCVLARETAPSSVRAMAAATLRNVAAQGDAVVFDALLASLRDPEIHNEVFHALEVIAIGRSTEVSALVAIACEATGETTLRSRALRCLSHVAARGDSSALACALTALEDSAVTMRVEAVDAVPRLAGPDDIKARAAVVARLADAEVEVREHAVLACEALLVRGDQLFVDEIVGYVVSTECCVRKTALSTLQRICKPGSNEAVFQVVRPWLETGHWPQRHAALEALNVTTTPGDPVVTAAVLKRVVDADETCRHMACEVIRNVSLPGDDTVIAALIERIRRDRSWLVRLAAKFALKVLATEAQTECLEELLTHPDEDVSRAAAEVLSTVRERSGGVDAVPDATVVSGPV